MKETHRQEFGRRIAALALAPDGKHIAAVVIGKQAQFYVGDIGDLKNLRPITIDTSDFSEPAYASLAFSPDGRFLAGAAFSKAWLSRLGDLTGKVHLWKYENLKSKRTQ